MKKMVWLREALIEAEAYRKSKGLRYVDVERPCGLRTVSVSHEGLIVVMGQLTIYDIIAGDWQFSKPE